ncbi:MAG: DUF4870 domain-containing protein [Halothece sp. Uz-M2-17]|nr:DUF4870 domain-containing protein [Halothece sp. Uz-M2-17]
MSQSQNSSDWSTLLHLSLLSNFVLPIPYIGIIVPILIWQFAQPRDHNFERHSENVINWIISSTIYSTIALISIIGIILLPVLAVLNLVFPIIAAIKANKDQVWSYPLTINFIGGKFPKQRLLATALALLILTLPALMGITGVGFWAKQRNDWIKNAITTQGSVVKIIEDIDAEGNTTHQPVIQFRDRAGESYQVTPVSTSNATTYETEDTVELLYSPENPKTAIINNWFHKWFLIAMIGIMSGVFFVFSLIPSGICLIIAQSADHETF